MARALQLDACTQRRMRAALAAIPLVLTACTTIGELQESAATPRLTAALQQINEPVQLASIAPVRPVPIAKPDVPSRAPEIRLARAETQPDELIGLNPDLVLELLGEPVWRQREPPSEIWQYNGNNCTLQLVLLVDVVTEEHRTVFYEVKHEGSEVNTDGDGDCLAEILTERRTRL